MKRWLWCAGALLLAAVLGGMPFVGTDIAKLHPAEVLRVQKTGDIIFVELDTGDSGKGKTLETAIQDLKESTPGKVFLETVESRVRVCTRKEVYEAKQKLYELKEILSAFSFAQINKSTLVNINFVKSIQAEFSGNYLIKLKDSKDVLTVSRKYFKEFKDQI